MCKGVTPVTGKLSANGDHTCGINSGGSLKCWGDNGFGQLGDGTTTDSPVPVQVSGM
jgi:alpha-tubulin suppressor-like RCC1 family protein